MSSLAAKYDYLEKLTRKVCHSQTEEPKKRAYGRYLLRFHFEVVIMKKVVHPKKKQKKETEAYQRKNILNTNDKKAGSKDHPENSTETKPVRRYRMLPRCVLFSLLCSIQGVRSEKEFNAVDILRKRLHQKIEEISWDRVLQRPLL
ncbi:hypothetical protein NFI96_032191 [Prochilodus magdalenae]|nr:hypothetical protein NFI96_032191 [Prochilodus magdalenae]